MCGFLLMISILGTPAEACSPLPPDAPVAPEAAPAMRDAGIRKLFADADTVVRVRTIFGGQRGTFLVTQTYRGEAKPFSIVTMHVMGDSLCGPGGVQWLSGGVLAYNSKSKLRFFNRFISEFEVNRAVELGLLSRPESPMAMGSIWGIVLVPAFLLALIAMVGRVKKARNRPAS